MVFQSDCVSGDPVSYLGVRELAVVSQCAIKLCDYKQRRCGESKVVRRVELGSDFVTDEVT